MHIKIGYYIVSCTQIIGTKMKVYQVWEPSSYYGDHSSLQQFDNGLYGDIASHRTQWRENQHKAYETILEAFPALRSMEHNRINGKIETYV
jgi:hypothetical protein